MDFTAFQNWAFLGMITILVYFAGKLVNKVDDTSTSIGELNKNFAVLLEKIKTLVDEKEDHEKRLRHVEYDVRLLSSIVAKDNELMKNFKLKGE